MKTIKLTPKQKEVIKLMRGGVKCYRTLGLNSYCFLSGSKNSISFPTLEKLERCKFIEVQSEDWRSINYHLTDLGKTINL